MKIAGPFQKDTLIVLTFASAILLFLIIKSIFLAEGHWIYTLDDAYIHIQMAKNLVASGTWGISPDTFTSCSSAPFWTLLLASLYSLVGVHESIPGIINVLACLAILFSANKTFASFNVAPVVRIMAGLSLLLICPLTVIVSTGMEHTLHVFLVVNLLLAIMKGLTESTESYHVTRKTLLSICTWGTLASGIRYETWFLVVPSIGLLAFFRQWRSCTCLLISASLPMLFLGFYSVSQGGFFLPNSLLLKGHIPDWRLDKLIQTIFSMYVRVSLENVHVHLLCILMLLTSSFPFIQQKLRAGLLLLTAGCILHLTLSECGWFYRYEAYLMTPGLILLCSAWLQEDRLRLLLVNRPKRKLFFSLESAFFARVLLLLILITPLFLRGVWANTRIVRASANIYEQQWQLARIFKTFPTEKKHLAVNDLGVMSYKFSPTIVDLWGLGSTEIARLKVAKTYNRETVRKILSLNAVDYVTVYEHWFSQKDLLPQELILVAKLHNEKNIVCLENTVMIYAQDRERAETLRKHLSMLPFKLPKGTSIEFCF
jgi:hypothetical protein